MTTYQNYSNVEQNFGILASQGGAETSVSGRGKLVHHQVVLSKDTPELLGRSRYFPKNGAPYLQSHNDKGQFLVNRELPI